MVVAENTPTSFRFIKWWLNRIAGSGIGAVYSAGADFKDGLAQARQLVVLNSGLCKLGFNKKFGFESVGEVFASS